MNILVRVEWVGNLCVFDCFVDVGQCKDGVDNIIKIFVGNEICLNNIVSYML